MTTGNALCRTTSAGQQQQHVSRFTNHQLRKTEQQEVDLDRGLHGRLSSVSGGSSASSSLGGSAAGSTSSSNQCQPSSCNSQGRPGSTTSNRESQPGSTASTQQGEHSSEERKSTGKKLIKEIDKGTLSQF